MPTMRRRAIASRPPNSARNAFRCRGKGRYHGQGPEINGMRGLFLLDTGATYVSVRPAFAGRAKIPDAGTSEITLASANGLVKAKLSRADKVALGKLEAINVPVAVQIEDKG